ncbi:DUF2637 domain-containing protein, partial [Streptomyces violascens]
NFSYVFPIGVDAGICVLLALDLLLTWMRIPFPLLRQTAWLLTAATIAFNGAAAWPDPLGVGMHAVIPVLFVVSVEAARHAVGRIADITADKHMEGVRLTRWLLSPVPTFLLWRRMKLWELRSYEQVIKLEQDRLVYRARLQSVYGRAWRRKAPVESLMPLRLAKFGVPLAETAPAGLAAAGMDPVLLPPPPVIAQQEPQPELPPAHNRSAPEEPPLQTQAPQPGQEQAYAEPEQPTTHESPWFAAQHVSPEVYEGTYDPAFAQAEAEAEFPPGQEQEPVMVPAGPGRERRLGIPGPRAADPQLVPEQQRAPAETAPVGEWDAQQQVDYADAARAFADRFGHAPDPAEFGWFLAEAYGLTDPATGGPLPAATLAAFLPAPEPTPAPVVPPPAAEQGAPVAGTHPFVGAPLDTPSPDEPVAASGMVPAPRPPAGSDSELGEVQEPGNEPAPSGPQPRPQEKPGGGDGPEQGRGTQNGKAADQTLTVVDRYFLAWEGYIAQHGQEPTGPQLSQHLASLGILNRNGSPVAPATLRRYLLEFRIYNVWAEQRDTGADPAVPAVLEELARRGITGQYNRPLEAATVQEFIGNFRRRYQVFSLDLSSNSPS